MVQPKNRRIATEAYADTVGAEVLWTKRALVAGEDLDALTVSGLYNVGTYTIANSLINRPLISVAVDRASIEVLEISTGSVIQRWTTARVTTSESPVMQRHRDSAGTWSEWRRTDDIAPSTRAEVLWPKRALVAGENLDIFTNPGVYTVPTYSVANSLINRPEVIPAAINRAFFEVFLNPSGNIVLQRWTTTNLATLDSPTVQRRRDDAGTWSEWRRTDDISDATKQYMTDQINAAKWLRMALVTGVDLNTLLTDGIYRVPTYAIANSLLNRPTLPAAVNAGLLEVKALANGACEQKWIVLAGATADSPVMRRRRDNGGTWTVWERTDKPLTPEVEVRPYPIASIAVDWAQKTHRGILRAMISESATAHPVWGWTAPVGRELTVPTHEGSGQTVHPSVLHIPGGWNGYTYWMAHTPYPFGNEDHEDPNIVASNDGETWVVPNGLTNPLDDQNGKPDPYNSDAQLTWGPNGELVCIWRMVDRPNGGQNILYWSTSTDGTTWIPKKEIFKAPLPSSESTAVSPSLHWLGDRWRMYIVRTMPTPNRLSYYETAEPDPVHADWGPVQDCPVTPGPTFDRDWWHIDIQRHDGEWVGIMNDVQRGTAGVDGDIYLMRSTDGISWEISTIPLVPKIAPTHDTIYKAGFVPSGTGGALVLDVFYSAFPAATREFRIYRTTARLASA